MAKRACLSLDPGCFFRKTGDLPSKFSFNLSSKDLSEALGNIVSSSRMARRPMGFSMSWMVASKVHAKVHHFPLDALPDVLLLLQHKHVVVEELLQLLITKVDTNLLKSVKLKDLKTSNIQDTNEVDLLHGGINQGSVTEVNKPKEEPV